MASWLGWGPPHPATIRATGSPGSPSSLLPLEGAVVHRRRGACPGVGDQRVVHAPGLAGEVEGDLLGPVSVPVHVGAVGR